MYEFIETQKLLTADLTFQTKQKPLLALHFIGAETSLV